MQARNDVCIRSRVAIYSRRYIYNTLLENGVGILLASERDIFLFQF